MPTDLPTYLSRLEALAANAEPGPYFTAPDPAPDSRDHKDSGLAMIETGRQGGWPPAMLMEWGQADYFAVCAPEVIRALCAIARAAHELRWEEAHPIREERLDDALAALTALAEQETR